MTTLKIAVYAICKNESQFVDRWMDSMQEADAIYVTDTGSSDDTAERLRARGAVVFETSIQPWRFDVARNASLHVVPGDFDVCVCTDLDEVLEPGWRKKLEEVWTEQTTRLKYMYTWSFQADGSKGIYFWTDKIHRRHGYRWTHPVHEVLRYDGEGSEVFAWADTIQLNHYPDPQKSRGQYLPLLEMAVQEDPDDDRNMHYLGREYMFHQMWDACIETLMKHLALPSAVWIDERCASMRYIARAYKAKGDFKAAEQWLYKAIAEASHLREPYVEMAQLAYEQKNWPSVFHMAEEALSINTRPISYLSEPSSWDYTLYDLGALSCYELGMMEKALTYAKIAYDMAPDDPRLENNYKIIQNKLAASESI